MFTLLGQVSDASSGGVVGLAWLALIAVAYFLPTICAQSRGHRNTMPIFILNLFLGWTGLGWIIALVWAFTADQSRRAP